VRRLAGRFTILGQAQSLVTAARSGMDVTDGVKALSATLLNDVGELSTHRRVVISAEGRSRYLSSDPDQNGIKF
jgi:hypothetical protein